MVEKSSGKWKTGSGVTVIGDILEFRVKSKFKLFLHRASDSQECPPAKPGEANAQTGT